MEKFFLHDFIVFKICRFTNYNKKVLYEYNLIENKCHNANLKLEQECARIKDLIISHNVYNVTSYVFHVTLVPLMLLK